MMNIVRRRSQPSQLIFRADVLDRPLTIVSPALWSLSKRSYAKRNSNHYEVFRQNFRQLYLPRFVIATK